MKTPFLAAAGIMVVGVTCALALGGAPGLVPAPAPAPASDAAVATAVTDGPPPWAVRRGQGDDRRPGNYRLDVEDVIVLPEDGRATCNHRLVSQVMGAVGTTAVTPGGAAASPGGAAARPAGPPDAALAPFPGGTIAAGEIGGAIGQAMDAVDVACAGQALEHLPTGKTAVWTNRNTGSTFSLEPTETWRATDGRFCRRYLARAIIGSQTEDATGTACRDRDRTWEIAG